MRYERVICLCALASEVAGRQHSGAIETAADMANQPLSLPNKEPGWAAKYDMPERSKPPRHPTQLTLSAVLASAPNLFNAPAGKLVAVGKRIAEIDGGLAPELQKAKVRQTRLLPVCLQPL